MLKRLLLIAFSLVLVVGSAPFASANGDCPGGDSHYARAVQLHDMGDYTRAERHYRCALAEDPDNSTIPILIENLHEDIASAPTAWSRPARASQSADAPAWQEFVMPDWLTPYELVPRAQTARLAAKPLHPIVFFTQRPPFAAPTDAPPDLRDGGLSFEDYVDFANWFSKRGELARTVKSVERALELQPGHHNLRCRLGALYRAQGDDQAAMRQFELVLANDAGNTCAVENRAALMQRLRDG